jgi:hypothetical protein
MARPGTINSTRAVDVSIHAVAPLSISTPSEANRLPELNNKKKPVTYKTFQLNFFID